MRIRIQIAREKIRENFIINHILLLVLAIVGFLLIPFNKRRAFTALSQTHRTSRSPFLKRLVEWWIVKNADIHRTPIKPTTTKKDIEGFLGKRIMVLKPPISTLEKGVLYVMYSELLHAIPYYFDMDRLTKSYHLVFEPSWSGYCTSPFLYYANRPERTFFLAAQKDDYRFLGNFKNMYPIRLGPCDWVDPRIADKYITNQKHYDVVMNSNWGSWKRHRVLFSAMRKMKSLPKVALIGFEWGGKTKDDIVELAKTYGVNEHISIYERIPFEEAMKIICYSRISILLSLKEGSNRAIAESIFCNVPVVVLENHVGGIIKNIVPETGELCSERELHSTIDYMLRNQSKYQPRKWGKNNISCEKSTLVLNEYLKQHSGDSKWTQDIAVRSNSPESTYYSNESREEYKKYNERLIDFLKDY